MLKEKKLSQDNIIMMFFVVMFVGITFYIFIDRSIVDVVFLLIIGYYFGKFLLLKSRR